MVLVAAPWLTDLADRDDVTAGDTADQAPRRAQLPDVLQLRCTPEGIDVPVQSIRPRRDGMHVTVENLLNTRTEVWVRSTSEDSSSLPWSSGRLVVEPGRTELRQPVPPGVLTVGCSIVGRGDQLRRVDLVDVDHLYDEPELSCSRSEQDSLRDLAVPEPTSSLVDATRQALVDYVEPGDTVQALNGYPGERLGDGTVQPWVRVERDDANVAFAQLGTDDRNPTAAGRTVWNSVSMVRGCTDFLTPPEGGGQTPSSG